MDWNQNPPLLAADATTREDLNGLANSKLQRDRKQDHDDAARLTPMMGRSPDTPTDQTRVTMSKSVDTQSVQPIEDVGENARQSIKPMPRGYLEDQSPRPPPHLRFFRRTMHVLVKFGKFVGPGFMVSVAYIDPGNYATDVAAGAAFRFQLLFIVLMSNLIAVFLQSLCIKLGTVTGLNLAENCKAHLPRWLNMVLYLFAEAAIIATDIAEVSGLWRPSHEYVD